MKKLLILISIFILQYSILNSQDTWVKAYNPFHLEYVEGSGWIELEVLYEVEDVLIAEDGGYVISGSFDRCIDDEPPMWFDHWGFLMKTDSDGNLLWAKKDSVDFLSENDNYAFSETEEGDFITVGGGYMMKRNSEGNELWSIPYDDFGVFSMTKTNDGNVILGGRSNYNASLRKINTDGETIWTSVIDLDSSIAYSVTQSFDGGYLLTGINYGENDVLVIKTDENGDSLWTRTYDGLGGNDRGNCIIETSNGDIIAVGEIHSRSIDTYIIKLSYNGNIIWSNIFSELAACYSITQSQDGNFVGYSWGGASTNTTHLFKINDNQDFIWNNQLNCLPANGDKSFQELNNGGFVCVGSLNNSIALNKTNEFGIVSSSDENIIETNSYKLMNYPNPFNPATTIHFELPFNIINPIIEIFNIKGQKIKQFSDISNKSSVIWDGNNNYQNPVSSGIYFYRIKSDNFVSKTSKMILLK